ncbi:MAG: hypothetical protein AAGD22_17750 [Verrucomicrobiota bacterium]
MWKALAGIAIALLAGSAYFGYVNQSEFVGEVEKFDVAQAGLDKAQADLEDTEEKLDTTNNTIANVESEIVTLESELQLAVAATAEVDLKDKELSEELEGMLTQIADLEVIKAKFANIEEFETDIAGKQAELEAVKQSILSAENALNIATDKVRAQQQTIAEYTELQRDQAAGVIRRKIRVPIREVYNEYGFVVLGAGENMGIVPKAKMDVTRNGFHIGTVTVATVDPSYSTATIDANTLSAGEQILAGDTVVPVAVGTADLTAVSN